MSPSVRTVKTISQKYRKYLAEIARIFVESGMNMAETVRRVTVQLPALSKFRWEHFARWKGNKEWEAAVQQAQSEAALLTTYSPQVRGQQFIAWAKDTLEHLEEGYKNLKAEEGGEKEKRDLEGRIQTLHTNLRAEERHLDDLEQRRAQRNMRQFVANVLEVAGQVTSIEECRARLEEVRREPLALMKGIE